MNARRWLLTGIVAAVCACGTQAQHEETPAEHAAAESPPAHPVNPLVVTEPSPEAPASHSVEVETEERSRPAQVTGIDPDADVIARAMADTLRGAKQLSFHAETSMERLMSNGSMVELPASLDITVRRPDGLRVDRRSVKGHRLFQYDGKTVGLLDVDRRMYAIGEAPPTIDAMIGALEERFDLVLPLSDIVADDPYIAFSSDFADDGALLGAYPYKGKTCDVLAYRNESIDWQIWVSREEPRVPMRLAIRYESEPGIPRFTADLSNWNLSDATPEADFTFAAPADAKKIEVSKRNASEPVAATEEGK